MICNKCNLISPTGSGENYNDYQSCYCFAITSPWTGVLPFIEQFLTPPPPPPNNFAKSGKNWPIGSGEETENVKVKQTADGQYIKRSLSA
jgi:hypothetical protein